MRTSRRTFLTVTVAAAALPAFAQTRRDDSLASSFLAPPDSARPRVWWHWMNGNISREGIAKDLAWMKRIGIGGAQSFDAARATPQIVERRLAYMTPEWKDAFRFAAERARALDLELAIASSPGWSETGGPWVQARDGMKKLVWSETVIDSATAFRGVLAAPPRTTGVYQDIPTNWEGGDTYDHEQETFYADVAVLAYPAAAQNDLPAPSRVTANGDVIDPALLDANRATGIPIPPAQQREPGHVRYEYTDAQTVRSAVIFVDNLSPLSASSTMIAHLEASDDGLQWRPIAQAGLKSVPSTLSFSPVSAKHFRLLLRSAPRNIDPSFLAMAPGVDIAGLTSGLTGVASRQQRIIQFELSSEARINAFEVKSGFAIVDDYFALDDMIGAEVEGVALADVVDLISRVSPDDRLDWTAPAGRWKVLRFGYSLTGRKNHPASTEATGLEVDKYDAEAVEAYCNTYLDTYRDAVGAANMGRRGLRALVMDSTEVGPSNWTARMMELFQRVCGYDLKQWLPALTGEIMASRAQSDAFLFDFRRALAELHASEHYATVAKVAHERGLIVYGEALEATRVSLGDDLDLRRFADIPMGALWTYARSGPQPALVADVRGAASIAHLTGRTLVACESLTSIGHPWAHAPSDLQPMIDTIFLHGVNRPVIHTSAHQPIDRAPGLTVGVFGQNFTRHETWAEMAGPWIDYISRNSYLLQQGRNVADVAYFYGEDRPVGAQAATGYMPDVPTRYAYDFVSTQALLNLLSVDNGDLISAGGARYKILYLGPPAAHMTLRVLRKLTELAEAGATLVGDAPQFAIGFENQRAEFDTLTRRLWSAGAVTSVGRGRVIAGRNIETSLSQIGVAPDFETRARPDAFGFVHRQLTDGELYFVSNRTREPQQADALFRTTGRAPEFWHADTGRIELAAYRMDGAHTSVPLDLGPDQSVFVVFRNAANAPSAEIATPQLRPAGDVAGPWRVAFQPGRGAPESAIFETLTSLSENTDPGVKYFSGIATYASVFNLPNPIDRSARLVLDLGRIGDIAEVRVNGRAAGIAWKAPYQVEIGALVREGANRLEIRVANLWVNRLIGDRQPGAAPIAFTPAPTFTAAAPLRPSGLIGPVTIWR